MTISQIAEETGVGRATLYKYFPDVGVILFAWYERHVAAHLAQLAAIRDQGGRAGERLQAVLEAYAFIRHEQPSTEFAAFLHRGKHMAHAQEQLNNLLSDLLIQGAKAGEVRTDIAPKELANYCLHALAGAGRVHSKAAVRRLVMVTLAGVRPCE